MNRWLKTEMVIVTVAMILVAGSAPAPAVAGDEARWKNAINLLPLIDPARDTWKNYGRWEIKDGALVSGYAYSTIKIPYQPPQEYDLRFSFTPIKLPGKDETSGIDVWLPGASGRVVSWCICSCTWRKYSGLEFVKGKRPSGRNRDKENPTTNEGVRLKFGRKHTAMVKVRKDSIMGYLDGKLITEWKGDWKDLHFNRPRRLGFDAQGPTIFHSIEVLEVTGKGILTREAREAARWKNAISLLPSIDPAKDSTRHGRGTWKVKDEMLITSSPYTMIYVPYKPPQEYDYRITFTKGKPPEGEKLRGTTDVSLPGSSMCNVELGLCMANKVTGLEFVEKRGCGRNPTTVRHAGLIKVGRRHTAMMEVRKNSIKVYLDGRLLTRWEGDWKDLHHSHPRRMEFRFVAYGPTTFHSIEVLEVTGKGTFARKAPPGTK